MDSTNVEKKIQVMCPTCHKTGTVLVDESLVEATLAQEGDSLLYLHVFVGDVCDHAFSIMVDANLKVRTSVKH